MSEPTTTVRFLACVSYGLVSVSITLFNKAVFSVYKFNFPNLVTTLQISVSIVYMLALRATKVLEFDNINISSARAVFPLALFWWLYVVSGVTALRYLTVPMYSTLRKSTTLLVILGEFLLFQRKPSPLAAVAVCVMVFGAVIAGLSDLSYSLLGYIWVGICIVSTAIYLLLIRLLGDRTGLNQSSLLYYNNMLAFPMMAGYALLATNEVSEVHKFPQLYDPKFQAFLLLSVSQAFLLNMCIFRCTTINSPLATTVTGQMKDILTAGLGMVLFGDVKFNLRNVVGVCIGILGGIGYSVVSYHGGRKKVKAADSEQGQALLEDGEGKAGGSKTL